MLSLLVCLSVLLQFACGFEVTCQSGPASACHLISSNDSCPAAHPPHQELAQCQELYEYSGHSLRPPYVERCPRSQEGSIFLRCNAFAPDKHDASFFLIASVQSVATSLDLRHFAVNVSWTYPDAERAIAVTPDESALRGYEVRVGQGGSVVECWCVWEPRVFNITLGLNLTLQYRRSTRMDLEVLTLPFSDQYPEDYYAKRNVTDWPSSCNDEGLVRPPSSCTPPLYPIPRHVQVESIIESKFNKTLQVSWTHPSVTPYPQLYYIYCTSERTNFTVVANGTVVVWVTGLDPNQSFSVRVQAYSSCSGVSSFSSSGFSGEVGCGVLSDPVPESAVLSTTPTTASPRVTSTVQLPIEVTTEQLGSTSPLVPVVLAVFSLLFILSLSVALTVFLCVRYRQKGPPSTYVGDFPDVEEILLSKPVKLDVLVLYSMNTPRSEQELIERCIVSRLKEERFQVNSCNNHTEKTVMEWVEERTRNARSILIICNKSFYSDWSSESRSPLINSLETLIMSSVANKGLRKYATVQVGKSSKQFVPENQYLRSMTAFTVGLDTVDYDMEYIYGFIELNRQCKNI